MLAEYGGAGWADEMAKAQLTQAWARRKQFEARLIAREVGQLFAGSGDGDRVQADELLGMAGISL